MTPIRVGRAITTAVTIGMCAVTVPASTSARAAPAAPAPTEENNVRGILRGKKAQTADLAQQENAMATRALRTMLASSPWIP